MPRRRIICLTQYGVDRAFAHLVNRVWKTIPDDVNEHDIIVLEGGTDISPAIYNQKPCAQNWPYHPERDEAEIGLINLALERNSALLGICRGAQLLTAFQPAGSLIQHVTGHTKAHEMVTSTGKRVRTSSLHHQMMWPYDMPKDRYELLAWSAPALSRCYLINGGLNLMNHLPADFLEPEVVWYPKIRGLAIQGHPEYVSRTDPFARYCSELVEQFLFQKGA